MKSNNLFVIIVLILVGCSEPEDNGSWKLVRNQEDDLIYRQIHFETSQIGWIVGDDGKICGTVDGGDTWTTQSSGVTSKLWDVSSVSKNEVWVSGTSGTILKSVDCGSSWQTLMQGDSSDGIFVSVEFVDSNVGWACNTDGSVYKSSDGGSTWNLSIKHFMTGAHQIFTFDGLTQYHSNLGQLYRTHDGGSTWDSVSIQCPNNYFSSDLSFVDANHGFASIMNGTGGMIINEYPMVKTTDAGQSWEESIYLHTGGFGFSSIHFVDEDTGWLGGLHFMYKTSDGGQTFDEQIIPEGIFPAHLAFTDENHGWALTFQGEVIKYSQD